MKNGLSIDVEEYFHALNLWPAFPPQDWDRLPSRVEVGVDCFLRLLDRSGHKATFFVLGWVAERHPDLVARILAQGHEVGSHGYSHRMAGDLGPEGFAEDVRRSLQVLHAAGAERVEGYRASTFSITRDTWWALAELARQGFRYDSSVFPVRHDRYGVPDFSRHPVDVEVEGRTIRELPLLTWRPCGFNLPAAGGGYLRQFPLWYTRRAVQAMNQEGQPAVLYVHPWELDPDQPRAPTGSLSRLSALRHYRNLSRTEARLRQLLEEFEFVPLGRLEPATGTAVTHSSASR